MSVQRKWHGPAKYTIEVQGHLGEHWSDWFDDLVIDSGDSGMTSLSIDIPDQAALHGLLARIRDLGLVLVSLKRVSPIYPPWLQD